MLYATLANLQARFGQAELVQLTDTVNIPPAVVDAARVQTKLEDACVFIDGYVGKVYRLPLAGCAKPDGAGGTVMVAPPVLTRLACDIARYYLYDDLAPENEVYRRYRAAVQELDAIAQGKSQLACPWGGSPGELIGTDAQSGGEQVQYSFRPSAMDDDGLRGFA